MQGEPNYNLLALSAGLHPSGARLVAALASAELMKQRQQAEQRQKELENQLSFVHSAETQEDPFKGLETLSGTNTGWRPESYKAIAAARKDLTGRAAARAAARARTVDRPEFQVQVPNMGLVEPEPEQTPQELPFSPDRAERAGAETERLSPPTAWQTRDNLTIPVPALDFPTGRRRTNDRSGGTAATAQVPRPGAIRDTESLVVPPTYRYPRSEEELRESLSDRERELLFQATGFKGLPPDLAAVEASVFGRKEGQPQTAEELGAMMKALEEQYTALPPEEQKAMAGRYQTAKSAVAIAQRNPKALLRSIGTVENFQSALEKKGYHDKQFAFKERVFQQQQAQFSASLSRLDQQIRIQNVQAANQEMDNANRLAESLRRQIDEMLADPVLSKVVGPLQESYLQLLGRLNHLQGLLQERRNEPLPWPPTGRGPDSSGNPGAHAPVGGRESGTRPPPSGVETPAPQGRKIKLKSGKEILVEP